MGRVEVAAVVMIRKAVLASIILWCSVFLLGGCDSPESQTDSTLTNTPIPTPLPEIGVSFSTVTPTRNATSTPLAAQPAATPTLTPTPEPVTHIVQPGETLIGIAVRYGLTLEELLDLNPNIQPQLLSIGQEILLPLTVNLDSEQPLGAPVEVSTLVSEGLEISMPVVRRTPSDSAWILGTVSNNTDKIVQNVQIVVSIASNQSEESIEYRTWIVPRVIPAGEQAPYGILSPQVPEDSDVMRAAIFSAEEAQIDAIQYAIFELEDPQVTIDGSVVRFSASIKNVGEESAANPLVVIMFFDLEQQITGYKYYRLPDEIGANQNAFFEIETFAPGTAAQNYRVLFSRDN